ncbi:MAG: DEAD/DEAH box helicase [Candidatus Paceibacterota bacterium]
MSESSKTLQRPIFLTRTGADFKLSFAYDPRLVERVKLLPYSSWDPDGRNWSVRVSKSSVELLRLWYVSEGLTDVCVDELLEADEIIPEYADATLRRGSLRRPFLVQIGRRSDVLFNRLKSLPGAQWEKSAQALSYPAGAAAALLELVNRDVIDDPDRLLQPSDITITFDIRTGVFKVIGDERAQDAFNKRFPSIDIVSEWKKRGFDVDFSDAFAEEVYTGEIARSKELHPVGLKEVLFPYQAQSVCVAVERGGFAIWDAPGLGKTAQAIAWAHELINNRKEADRCVIVTPGAVKTQFAREIKRFTGNDDVVVIDGDKNKRHLQYKQALDKRWVVLNYDLLHLDLKHITPLVNGQLLVADEAHRLKSRQSKRGLAARTLAGKAIRRLALSGTPIENDPAEWYTLMNGFVVPGIFGNPFEFFNRYAYPGRFGGFEGARNLGELRDRSKPHYIRHKKDEVATHLPPLRVQNLVLDPDEKLAAALKRAHRDAQDEIADYKSKGKDILILDENSNNITETGAAMTAVGMLRMMCASPRLIHRSESEAAKALCAAGLVPDVDGPKVDEIRSLAAELQRSDERVVVFTSFRSFAALVAERFKEDGIRYVMYTGESSSKEREAAVKSFTSAKTEERNHPTVFLATDAASEGLNLGKECSTLVNLDLPFKPSTLIQRGNRIHRVDGDISRRYLVINYSMAKTVEEGIIRLIGAKADLSDAVLGEAGSRKATTGRFGRSVFEEAIKSWDEEVL